MSSVHVKLQLIAATNFRILVGSKKWPIQENRPQRGEHLNSTVFNTKLACK